MTNKKHPLEELLELEEGSTPINDPLKDDSDETIFDSLHEETNELTESDETDLYDIDTSISNTLEEMPKEVEIYDRTDKKIENKYESIYNHSIRAYSQQMQESSLVEGKYKARNAEVAAQYLRIALDAAKDAANQKANKDKIKFAEKKSNINPTGKSNNNTNIFFGDTNELLRLIEDSKNGKSSPKIVNPDEDEL